MFTLIKECSHKILYFIPCFAQTPWNDIPNPSWTQCTQKPANHKPVNKRKDAHNKAANKHKQPINNLSVSRVQHLFQLAHSMARKLSQSSIRVNCNLVLRLQPQMETKIHRNICYSRSVLPSFLSTHTLIEKSSYFLPDCLFGMQKLAWTVQTFGRFMWNSERISEPLSWENYTGVSGPFQVSRG